MPSAQLTKKRKQVTKSQEGSSAASRKKKKVKRDAASHVDVSQNSLDVSGGIFSPGNRAEKRLVQAKEKGKGKETAFQVVQSSLVVSISPVFASDPRVGVEETLDSMIMRYIPALDGVVLSHSNLSFNENTAAVQADCPFLVCKIVFDAIVWRPLVGMKLVGKISLCSPDHISLLIHKTFNVSIPQHHIPTEEWEFEYGAAENDPEFGAGTVELESGGVIGLGVEEGIAGERVGSGRWIHRVTASYIGGDDGYLEFTVIGITVANEMLSLIGSLQRDPFSEAHVPSNGVRSTLGGSNSSRGPERSGDDEDQDEREQDIVDGLLNGVDVNEDEDAIESDQDGFEALNERQNDMNAERERERRVVFDKANEKEEAQVKEKRKRKDNFGGKTRANEQNSKQQEEEGKQKRKKKRKAEEEVVVRDGNRDVDVNGIGYMDIDMEHSRRLGTGKQEKSEKKKKKTGILNSKS
ncbi:hypothetical protein J3R30DRAFT_3560115 [Lentinula aciculospora]|uniref:RPA43 OB domain-containing protein n=1 Tax=Lentinula aciculospora TaxID=153920 RepID=A0A9W8ZWT2_9AGAR|nr:hypothetical protein J3R30DRAFT_3560115 [Lentinula aciculospora]